MVELAEGLACALADTSADALTDDEPAPVPEGIIGLGVGAATLPEADNDRESVAEADAVAEGDAEGDGIMSATALPELTAPSCVDQITCPVAARRSSTVAFERRGQ